MIHQNTSSGLQQLCVLPSGPEEGAQLRPQCHHSVKWALLPTLSSSCLWGLVLEVPFWSGSALKRECAEG